MAKKTMRREKRKSPLPPIPKLQPSFASDWAIGQSEGLVLATDASGKLWCISIHSGIAHAVEFCRDD